MGAAHFTVEDIAHLGNEVPGNARQCKGMNRNKYFWADVRVVIC